MLLKTKIEIENWLNKYNIKNYSLIEDNKYGYIVNVNDSVYLSSKKLINIDVKFNKVNGGFFCFGNKLKSLKGCPEEVNGHFDCSDNELESLEESTDKSVGCPEIIQGFCNCSYNKLNVDEIMYLIDKKIEKNYVDLYLNEYLGELQNITNINELKQILSIIKEKNYIIRMVEKTDKLVKKLNKI